MDELRMVPAESRRAKFEKYMLWVTTLAIYMYLYVQNSIPGGKERVCAHLIGGSTRFLDEKAHVLPHGTTQNHSFLVQSMTKSTWSCSDSARIRTFGR